MLKCQGLMTRRKGDGRGVGSGDKGEKGEKGENILKLCPIPYSLLPTPYFPNSKYTAQIAIARR
jgi:hypothetical protein